MSAADAEQWDARHAAVDPVGALPPSALRGREALLPPGGAALDVACGRGAVTLWLAERGFAVDAVDVSRVGLAALAGVSGVRCVAHDLDLGLPPSCPGPYDVIVCQRFRAPALYPGFVERLAPGGLLVLTVLSEVGDEPGRFRAGPGELLNAFGALDVLAHTERDGEAGLVARAPGRP